MEDKQIIVFDLERLTEELLGQMYVVSEAVLELTAELGQVTARHQLTCFEEGGPVVVHVPRVLLRLSGDADHLTHGLIPVQTSSKCLSNSGDTESGFWGEAGSGSF